MLHCIFTRILQRKNLLQFFLLSAKTFLVFARIRFCRNLICFSPIQFSMCSRQVAAPILAAACCRCHTRGGRLPLPYSRTGYSAFSVVRARVRRLRFPLALRLNGRLPHPYSRRQVAAAILFTAFLLFGLTADCGRLPLPYSRAVVSAFSVFAPASGVSAFRLRSGSIAD